MEFPGPQDGIGDRTSTPLSIKPGTLSGQPLKYRGITIPSNSLQSGHLTLSFPKFLQSRKFGEAGIAMRAHLMGWRHSSEDAGEETGARTAQDVIVDQSKSLCGRYLRCRLRDLPPVVQKRLSFQRLKSVSNMIGAEEQIPSVLTEIKFLCRHLETSKPELYGSLLGNIGIRSFPATEHGVKDLLTAVISELFRNGEVSWGKVAAIFSVTGALALDCVKANRPELVLGLVETTGQNVNNYVSQWIAQQGGWEAMADCFRSKPSYTKSDLLTALMLLIICSLLTAFTGLAMWTQINHKQTQRRN